MAYVCTYIDTYIYTYIEKGLYYTELYVSGDSEL